MRILAILLAALLSSCGAMFTGTESDVHFTSNPPGASVRAGSKTGTTPCTLSVSKWVREVQFSLDGYDQQSVPTNRTFMPGFLVLDILFTPGFGLTGVLFDGASQGWMKLPVNLHADLERSTARSGPPSSDSKQRHVSPSGPGRVSSTPSDQRPAERSGSR